MAMNMVMSIKVFPFRLSQLIGRCKLLLIGFRQPLYIALLSLLLIRPLVITDYWPVTTLNLQGRVWVVTDLDYSKDIIHNIFTLLLFTRLSLMFLYMYIGDQARDQAHDQV
ncbi:unnamed protein product [Camellia sinensis]